MRKRIRAERHLRTAYEELLVQRLAATSVELEVAERAAALARLGANAAAVSEAEAIVHKTVARVGLLLREFALHGARTRHAIRAYRTRRRELVLSLRSLQVAIRQHHQRFHRHRHCVVVSLEQAMPRTKGNFGGIWSS